MMGNNFPSVKTGWQVSESDCCELNFSIHSFSQAIVARRQVMDPATFEFFLLQASIGHHTFVVDAIHTDHWA